MERFVEIDVIKGVAVILMIFFHIFYLMNNMGLNGIDSSKGIIAFTAPLAHYTFIIFSGINLFITYNKSKDKDKFKSKQVIRSLKLFGFAMIITFVSYITFGKRKFVKFGILHFMAAVSLLSLFTIDNLHTNIILLICLVLFGIYANNNTSKFDGLCKKNSFVCFILGIYSVHTNQYGAMDHFDILSKFPVFILGVILGHIFYKNKKPIKNNNDNIIVNGLAWLGKNSLTIYMLHWVVLYAIIYMFGGRPQT